MMRKPMLTRSVSVMVLGLFALTMMSGVARAQESEASLAVDLDYTWTSKYVWRGYDLFDDHAASQPSVNFDLWGTGFSVNVWQSIPMGSGSEDWHELDYTVAYGTTFFEGERYAIDFGANYIYYDFYKQSSKLAPDTEEVGAGVSMPALIPIGESYLVPSYYAGKLWPVSDDKSTGVAGIYHTFGLSYDLPVPTTDLALSFFSDINYNDGLFSADHDWSHATFGVSTSMEVIENLSVSPFLNFQVSMEDTVNTEDELYGGVSVTYSF